MSEIERIRKITATVKAEKSAAAKKAAQTRKAREKAEHLARLAEAKDVCHYMTNIEEEAKKGKHEYSVSLGGDEDDIYIKEEIKAITNKFKDFNPVFKREPYTTYSYNYDGCAIDGTDKTNYSMIVYFRW